jgi:poly-gamma-glutamate capsule biosynthesis protein CapA/YwtB (metallophosphatase superfamily)
MRESEYHVPVWKGYWWMQMTTISVAAVGDILMWHRQIQSAKQSGQTGYAFESMFADVRSSLQSPDLTIGNLETTLSGRERIYERTSPRTHYPMFNCPDELAKALKWAGFDVLTTANNHCMDRGESGLKRTLRILDNHNLLHTGTSASRSQAGKLLIRNVRGIRIGIVAYTYGTNFIEVPEEKSWLVNRIWLKKMESDLLRLRQNADIVMAAVHFGQEFHRDPNEKQRHIADKLFHYGADVVLGAHPHVLQRMQWKMVKDKFGVEKRRFVIYSLGNFTSVRMWKNPLTQLGAILTLTIEKNEQERAQVIGAKLQPTWTLRENKSGVEHFRVVPVLGLVQSGNVPWSVSDGKLIHKVITNMKKS